MILVVLLLRCIWVLCIGCVWLCWALIAVAAMMIATATGHRDAARFWQRSMRWGRWLL